MESTSTNRILSLMDFKISLLCEDRGVKSHVIITILSLTQIGCVLNLQPENIGNEQWIDTSGNNLHGSVDGAIPTNLPDSHIEKYIDLNVTGDTTFTLPANYKVSSIVVKETAGHNLGGGLDVGIASDSTSTVTDQIVIANDTVDCTLNIDGVIQSTTSDTTMHITSVNWNSAELEVYINMQRMGA